MRKFSRILILLFMIVPLGFPSSTLLAKTLTTDSSSKGKKHPHHKKKKVTNEDAIPLESQTEVTDQREVSGQPADSTKKTR
jgi:hypothetical protein